MANGLKTVVQDFEIHQGFSESLYPCLKFQNLNYAEEFLKSLIKGNWQNRQQILAALSKEISYEYLNKLSDEEIIRRLGAKLVNGHLKISLASQYKRAPFAMPPQPEGTPAQAEAASPASQPAPAAEKKPEEKPSEEDDAVQAETLAETSESGAPFCSKCANMDSSS